MKKLIFWGFLVTFLLFYLTISEAEFKLKSDAYRNWNHVKSMVIFDEKHPLYNPFGGIHHVYVNKKGLEAIKKGEKRVFPDGSVLVFVLYEHKQQGGAYVEGNKKLEAFMVKDSKKYKNTDGWGYYAYDNTGKSLVKDMKKDCHECHGAAKANDYVYSLWTK